MVPIVSRIFCLPAKSRSHFRFRDNGYIFRFRTCPGKPEFIRNRQRITCIPVIHRLINLHPIPPVGVYSVVAEKEGEEPEASGDFRIFYVHVPEFELSVVEETKYDCEGIKLRIDGFQPAYYLF